MTFSPVRPSGRRGHIGESTSVARTPMPYNCLAEVCVPQGSVVVSFEGERRKIASGTTVARFLAGNLLVVLCGETEAKPVINTGTLYQ